MCRLKNVWKVEPMGFREMSLGFPLLLHAALRILDAEIACCAGCSAILQKCATKLEDTCRMEKKHTTRPLGQSRGSRGHATGFQEPLPPTLLGGF